MSEPTREIIRDPQDCAYCGRRVQVPVWIGSKPYHAGCPACPPMKGIAIHYPPRYAVQKTDGEWMPIASREPATTLTRREQVWKDILVALVSRPLLTDGFGAMRAADEFLEGFEKRFGK